jgi:glc operon protein GlcG
MPLVTRNHPKLTLEGARAIMTAAEKRALEMNCPVDISLVDDGGFLLVFTRMDGAKTSSVDIAIAKARAAALRRAPTRPVMDGEVRNAFVSFGLAVASPDQQTPLRGGLPLIVDGEVVGGIGVSAGTEDQDVEIATAGAKALEGA